MSDEPKKMDTKRVKYTRWHTRRLSVLLAILFWLLLVTIIAGYFRFPLGRSLLISTCVVFVAILCRLPPIARALPRPWWSPRKRASLAIGPPHPEPPSASSPLNSRAKRQLSLFKRPHYQQHIGFSLWIGTALVLFGVIVTLTAALNHRRMVRMLNKDQPLTFRPLSVSVIVALALGFLGLLVACYLPLGLNAATSRFRRRARRCHFRDAARSENERTAQRKRGHFARPRLFSVYVRVLSLARDTVRWKNCPAHHHPNPKPAPPTPTPIPTGRTPA